MWALRKSTIRAISRLYWVGSGSLTLTSELSINITLNITLAAYWEWPISSLRCLYRHRVIYSTRSHPITLSTISLITYFCPSYSYFRLSTRFFCMISLRFLYKKLNTSPNLATTQMLPFFCPFSAAAQRSFFYFKYIFLVQQRIAFLFKLRRLVLPVIHLNNFIIDDLIRRSKGSCSLRGRSPAFCLFFCLWPRRWCSPCIARPIW